MGKTGPGWKGTDSVIILFKNTLPSLLRAIQTKARAPTWPPTPARVQSQAVTRASLPGRPPALCVPSLFLIVSKLLHRTCIFLTHSKVKSATSQVHALPLDPVPVYFPSRTRHPHAFSPRRARGSGSARGHSRVRVTLARAPPTCASPAPGARRSAPVRALQPC